METLLAIAPRAGRVTDARLTRFAWSPLRVPQRSASNAFDPAHLEMAGAAAAVIETTQNDSSARGRHDAGIAYLIIGRDNDGVDALEAAAEQSPKDAAIWNDLSAARYTLAVRENRAYELPQALAAADQALLLQSNLPEARFNRALIVEQLGVLEAARRAWQRYSEIDRSSNWANEASQHLGRLPVVTTEADFKRELAIARKALESGNAAPVAALVRNYPQEARTWGEVLLLAEWADSLRAGNSKRASDSLGAAREIGKTLLDSNHEGLLADAVAAIDKADGSRTPKLAEAHTAYRDGRLLYSKRQISDAQTKLEKAAALFAEGSSPMSYVASYYVGSAQYDKNAYADARQMLTGVATRFDHDRYRSLDALIKWELSLCDADTGKWGTAIRNAGASSRTLALLGELRNRAYVDTILSSELDHAGQPHAAWKARTSGFAALSQAGATDRIRQGLIAAIRSEVARGNIETALALCGVALDDLQRGSESSVGASFLEAYRAELLDRIGEKTAARGSIAAARHSAATIPDQELRLRAAFPIDIAEAIVDRSANPEHSLKLLDSVIASLTQRGSSFSLAQAYLERGRTQIARRNSVAALDDFEHGIGELRAQRSSLSDTETRGDFYDTGADLFAEATSLLLQGGQSIRAFALADSARARSLYEQLDADVAASQKIGLLDEIKRALPPRTAVVEYAMLKDTIAIFFVGPNGSGVVTRPLIRKELQASIERLGRSIQQRGDLTAVQREGATLFETLVAPLNSAILGAEALVVIPDRDLNAIPFGALYDRARNQYLIERLTISVAPSASFLLRRNPQQALSPALVVGDPRSSNEPALPEAAQEAKVIAAMYDSPTLLVGDLATPQRFVASARQSALIHYAGHAQSDSDEAYSALRLADNDRRDAGDLDAEEISRINLLKAPLVLLSACGTIRGEAGHVEGTPSVARAFLAAGARGVIGTLWEVNDDTASRLFRGVHTQLRSGLAPAAALRAAQLDLLHGADMRLRHPSAWAPIELLGAPN